MIKYFMLFGLAYTCYFLGRVNGLKASQEDILLANMRVANCINVITHNGINEK